MSSRSYIKGPGRKSGNYGGGFGTEDWHYGTPPPVLSKYQFPRSPAHNAGVARGVKRALLEKRQQKVATALLNDLLPSLRPKE